MEKYEYNDVQKILYTSKRSEPFFVNVPNMNYLTFRGGGHPNENDFQKACEVLFSISYLLKFEIARKQLDFDYKVNPMEVTWFLDKENGKTSFTWDMMIMQPEFITKDMVMSAINIAKDKGKLLEYDRMKFECIEFGKCIQCFHKGDYNLMNDTLDKMKVFAMNNHVKYDLYTHDIYLNDMRKTKTENYKTIMRVKSYPDENKV